MGGIGFTLTSLSISFSGNLATAELTLIENIDEEYTIASTSSEPVSICLDGSYYNLQLKDIFSWATSKTARVPCQISDTKIQISSLLSLEA